MAKQTGRFVDDARLYPRDNSGGPMGPNKGGEFGGGGKTIGGEPANTGGEQDEMKSPKRQRGG